MPVDICETPQSLLPCVSRYEIQRFHLRTPTSWLTVVLGTCEGGGLCCEWRRDCKFGWVLPRTITPAEKHFVISGWDLVTLQLIAALTLAYLNGIFIAFPLSGVRFLLQWNAQLQWNIPDVSNFPVHRWKVRLEATPQPGNPPSCWSTAASHCTESELLIRFLSLSYH